MDITIIKKVNILELDGSVYVDAIILDFNFKNNLTRLLTKYIGPNEDYIKLIYNNRILNKINIFNIDNDFIIPNNIDNIQVVKDYKKYVYIIGNNEGFQLINNYGYDKYYKLLSCINIDDEIYNNIISLDYYNLVLLCIEQSHFALIEYVSEYLKNDYTIILTAVKSNAYNLVYASNDMKNNYDIVLAAVIQDYNMFTFASKDMNVYDIVLEVVNQNGNMLKYVSDEMKNNYNIVFAAIKNKSLAIEYASENMKNELYQEAENRRGGYKYLDLERSITDTYDCTLMFVKDDGRTLKHVLECFKNNYDIVLAAVNNDGISLQYASYIMRSNYDIVLAAVKNNGHALKFASNDMKNNYDIVLATIKNNWRALQHASNDIKDNYDIALAAYNINKSALQYVNINTKILIDDY